MSKNIAVQGNAAVGLVTPEQTFAKINGNPILVHGDAVASHPSGNNGTHTGATMVGSAFVTINGKAAVLDGDSATCGHKIVGTGFVTVTAPNDG